MGHYGPDGDAEHQTDLLVGDPLQVAQDDRGPVLLRQGLQRAAEVGHHQSIQDDLFGRRRHRAFPDDGAGVDDLIQVIQREEIRLPLAAPVAVDEGVPHDSKDPGPEAGPRLKPSEPLQGLYEALLEEVLRPLGVPQEPTGGSVERIKQGLNQAFELPALGRIELHGHSLRLYVLTFPPGEIFHGLP
jgi:hypothetical protein